jgi:glutathione synthase/RimK-type ligase-like ATP-grasp enzyme
MPRIALVTYSGLPSLSADDQLLLPALAARGIEARPAAWDDPGVPWREFDLAIVRSTWNYHLDPSGFGAWLDRLEQEQVELWNPPAVLRWNSDKRYLLSLAGKGVPIANTHVVEVGQSASLTDVLEQRGWRDAVVKPVVSASAHETWRVAAPPTEEDEGRFQRLLADRAVMVQRFIPQVVQDGEWSLVFIAGAFSHAIVKRPATGDFRVQAEHGGTAEVRTPTPALLDDARAIMTRVPQRTLYARVDGCALAGRLLLMELELLEPSLFLAFDAKAPGRFAEAVERLLGD